MINKFKNKLNKEFPFLKGARLLVTVSGGIDSVILTHLLHQLGVDISIAHCNFCLRGKDSDNDELFVKELAYTLNTPFYTTRFDTQQYASQQKLSIQESARNLRYDWFEEIRKKYQLDYILTAHNLNDSLETFLINLSRGTGLKGLTGIPTVNGKIIRPLSFFSRKEIEVFALNNTIKWREDKSNTDIKYNRNKIRHTIIPVLEEINPNILESFKQTLENLQGSATIVTDKVLALKKEVKEGSKINIQKLQSLDNRHAYLFELFSPYGFSNTDDINHLLTAQSGKQLFSKTYRLVKDRETLLLVKLEEPQTKDKFEFNESDLVLEGDTYKLALKNKLNLDSLTFKTTLKNSAQFDKELLKFPLTVRRWQNSDYFYPIGMKGKKKLSKYFKDEKLSLIEKENIWLLLSDNKIIWVIGMRQDERYKITDDTKNIVKILAAN